jgi:hypothetical protein
MTNFPVLAFHRLGLALGTRLEVFFCGWTNGNAGITGRAFSFGQEHNHEPHRKQHGYCQRETDSAQA